MSKAIAVHAVFLVAVISIFLFFVVGIFFKWIDTTNLATNQATCTIKRLNYCTDWNKACKDPGDWDTRNPQNCDNVGMQKPDWSFCKELTRSKKISC